MNSIEKARAKRAERCELTADWVVDELRKIGFANMADYIFYGTTLRVYDPGSTDTRWSFTDITADSFRWLAEFSTDGGATWRLRAEFKCRRKA